jgi:hypothetical protein
VQDIKVDSKGNIYLIHNYGLIYPFGIQSATLLKIHPNGIIEDIKQIDAYHLAIGPDDTVYVGNLHSIWKLNSTGAFELVAGRQPLPGETASPSSHGDGGPATSALLTILDFGIGPGGDIFIAEALPNSIRKINSKTGIITTIAGSNPSKEKDENLGDGGPAANAQLGNILSITVDSAENIYFIDGSFNWRIRKIDPQGIITSIFKPGYISGFITLDKDGNLLLADTSNNTIKKFWGIAAPWILPSALPRLKGDVNGDDQIKVADAILLLRSVTGLKALSVTQQLSGDMNGDGNLGVQDIVLLLKLILQTP